MATTYPIVNLDKITRKGATESVVNTTADMPNGSFIHLGALATGERELRNVVTPSTASIANTELLMVASDEVQYLPGTNLQDFYNPQNQPAKAVHFSVGDIFTISNDALDGTITVNQWVEPQNGSMRLIGSATLPTTRFIGQVIRSTTIGFTKKPASVIQVINC